MGRQAGVVVANTQNRKPMVVTTNRSSKTDGVSRWRVISDFECSLSMTFARSCHQTLVTCSTGTYYIGCASKLARFGIVHPSGIATVTFYTDNFSDRAQSPATGFHCCDTAQGEEPQSSVFWGYSCCCLGSEAAGVTWPRSHSDGTVSLDASLNNHQTALSAFHDDFGLGGPLPSPPMERLGPFLSRHRGGCLRTASNALAVSAATSRSPLMACAMTAWARATRVTSILS
jgi:hypothetical protein